MEKYFHFSMLYFIDIQQVTTQMGEIKEDDFFVKNNLWQ
jgi:hypothetical protein